MKNHDFKMLQQISIISIYLVIANFDLYLIIPAYYILRQLHQKNVTWLFCLNVFYIYLFKNWHISFLVFMFLAARSAYQNMGREQFILEFDPEINDEVNFIQKFVMLFIFWQNKTWVAGLLWLYFLPH